MKPFKKILRIFKKEKQPDDISVDNSSPASHNAASEGKNRFRASPDEVLPKSFEETLTLHHAATGSERHLFVFLDGTWNEERVPVGEVTPTNVLRMFQEISKQSDLRKNPNVIARYYRGVGSRQDNNGPNRAWFGFNGKDEQRIRAAAFAGLYRDYQSEKDSIYIIGFSRGAASARLLARDICGEGLPPKLNVRTRHFANLLTRQIEARIEDVKRIGDAKVFPSIKFLGCWDTVDAFVLPSRYPTQGFWEGVVRVLKYPIPRLFGKERFRGDENQIPDKVEKAVHCVAIDETRNAFLPTLMPSADNVEEVWFPGVHSDVGGGYGENLLANKTYEFMKKRLLSAAAGATANSKANFFPETDALNASPTPNGNAPPSYCFHFHGLNAGPGRAKNIFGFGTRIRRIRVLPEKKEAVQPNIHTSIFEVMESHNVFAANKGNTRTWRINYDPYNVRNLEKKFKQIET